MSKVQRVILLGIIIILAIIICIIGVYIQLRKQGLNSEDEYYYIEEVEPEEEIQAATVRNSYYIVEDCINKYYTYISVLSDIESYYGELDSETLQEVEDENLEMIYNMLDEEYISNEKIATTNLISKIESVNVENIDINSMYVSELSTNISIYIVNLTLREKTTNDISNLTMIVKLDFANETFSIMPHDYVEENYSNLQLGETIDIEVEDYIEINDNNQYIFKVISDETYATDLFAQCKEELMYNQEEIYGNLDEEYSKEKFGNLVSFKSYIESKYENIGNITVDSYQKTTTDDYTQYVVIDSERKLLYI